MDFEQLARDFIQTTQLNATPVVEYPCRKCGSAVLWLDAGGGRHCPDCDPPVTPAMARRRVVISHGTGLRGSDVLVDIGGGGERGERVAGDVTSGTTSDTRPRISIDNYWASLPGLDGIPTPEQCAAARGSDLIGKAAAVRNPRKRRSRR